MNAIIPLDVWAETLLTMLDARSIMVLAAVCDLSGMPPGASFAPTRALSRDELAWFAARGISVRRLSSVLYTFRDYDDSHHSPFLPKHDECYPLRAWVCDGNQTNNVPRYRYTGSRAWWANRCLHRDDGLPAAEFANGDREWFFHGELHRDNDLPAHDGTDGHREWYVHGVRHRDGNLPALEDSNGDRTWYVHGELHRDNALPAVERASGYRAWYVRGIERCSMFFPK